VSLDPRKVSLSNPIRRRSPPRITCCVLFVELLLGAAPVAAQGLPLYHPVNPAAESRTPLYFQPFVDSGAGWHGGVSLDYASMIELNQRTLSDTIYVLDAEVMRLNAYVRRDVGRRGYLTAETYLGGAYDGFLDGFLNWYHGLLGINIPERVNGPRNRFSYARAFAGPPLVSLPRKGLYLGDLRLGGGYRIGRHVQSQLTLTLPTNGAGDGYAKGVASVGLLNTVRLPFAGRWTYEGSLGLGYTPGHGPIRDYQQTEFWLLTSGLRYRFWGRASLFANFFYHSPYYHDTGASSLDRRDLTLDFGGILRTRSGTEFRIGMTEDPSPSGPAIDLDFRFGWSW
jgi:hypothetical protein